MSLANWQHEWQQSVQSVAELLEKCELSRAQCPDALEAADFPVRVPQSYLKRIRKRDPHDPLLRQVLPLNAEKEIVSDYYDDPVDDQSAVIHKGILQKYQKRVLLLVTGACAIHCRYCFRKNFSYQEHALNHQFEPAINHIQADTSIEEVILSGGDPLSLNNHHLLGLCQKLENIPHIRRLRIHTRLPISLPARLDQELVSWINSRIIPYVIVFHINHPAEINREVSTAIQQLKHPTLMNQAVLLKGVNDHADTLIELSHACFETGVLPYYLHMLDKVQGTAHFAVDVETAKQLIKTMQASLPGYLVPKLVQETPGEPSKTLL